MLTPAKNSPVTTTQAREYHSNARALIQDHFAEEDGRKEFGRLSPIFEDDIFESVSMLVQNQPESQNQVLPIGAQRLTQPTLASLLLACVSQPVALAEVTSVRDCIHTFRQQ